MTMTRDLGKLLVSIDNAVVTVFGDDAFITHLIPSPNYKDEGVILDITISVLKDRYTPEVLEQKLEVFDNLVYNPIFNSDHILTKVDIAIKEL